MILCNFCKHVKSTTDIMNFSASLYQTTITLSVFVLPGYIHVELVVLGKKSMCQSNLSTFSHSTLIAYPSIWGIDMFLWAFIDAGSGPCDLGYLGSAWDGMRELSKESRIVKSFWGLEWKGWNSRGSAQFAPKRLWGQECATCTHVMCMFSICFEVTYYPSDVGRVWRPTTPNQAACFYSLESSLT